MKPHQNLVDLGLLIHPIELELVSQKAQHNLALLLLGRDRLESSVDQKVLEHPPVLVWHRRQIVPGRWLTCFGHDASPTYPSHQPARASADVGRLFLA